jgi:hypothetical protein
MTRSEIEAAQPALKNEIVHERWLESEPTPDSLQQASDNEKQTTRRKQKMANNKPIKKVQVGQVSVAVWENEINGDKGERIVERVTVDKRYKDATGWKSTGSFNVNEIPKLILALEKAYEFLTCKPKENGDGEEAVSDDHE